MSKEAFNKIADGLDEAIAAAPVYRAGRQAGLREALNIIVARRKVLAKSASDMFNEQTCKNAEKDGRLTILLNEVCSLQNTVREIERNLETPIRGLLDKDGRAR